MDAQTQAWFAQVLQNLSHAGADGQAMAAYLHRRRVGFGFRQQDTGAMWRPINRIYLNYPQYSLETSPNDSYMLSLMAHEARHLQQGLLTAFSVYGELDAWKLGFRVYKDLGGSFPNPAFQAILDLPLSGSRSVLRQAVVLMKEFSPVYQAEKLPLYPLTREAWYWLTRQEM
jgi:hypothetical protein